MKAVSLPANTWKEDVALLVDFLYGTEQRTRRTLFFCMLGLAYATLIGLGEQAQTLSAHCVM